MPEWIWPGNDPVVPSDDRGLAYGHGVFETLRVTPAGPVLLEAHRERLLAGCHALGIPFDADGLDAWQQQAAERGLLAPQAPLGQAVSVAFAVALGFGDALGALAPPEVAVHYEWPGVFRVNGARCGAMRVMADTADATAEPDWLVIALDVPFLPEGADPGETPDRTCLGEEGCVDITPERLLESWSRHTLMWINTWMTDGFAPLHEAWRARARGIGEDLPEGGTFVGLDEWGGQLVRSGAETRLRPLTRLLEAG